MSRARAVIADAVAAVIAAHIEGLDIDHATALTTARAAVHAIEDDGWHISALPPRPRTTTQEHRQ